MTGGLRSRNKGLRRERELAHLVDGERVPLSGAAGGSYIGDVTAFGLTFEVKARAAGFKLLYRWLENADALALKADREPWLVVIPLDLFKDLQDALEEAQTHV